MAFELIFVGGGRMGSALCEGLVAANWRPVETMCVVESSPEQRALLKSRVPGLTVLATLELEHVGLETGAVLCVKPDHAEGAARLCAAAGVTRVLSVVAGLSCARIEAVFPGPVAVVRSMPNTPVLVSCEPGSLVAALRYLLQDAVSHADRGSEVSLVARFAANRSLLVEIAAAGVVEGHDLSGQMAAPPPQGRNAGPAIGPLLARTTIEAMGGTLLFSDAIDSGRTTRLSLPSCRVTTRDAAA